MNGPCRRSRRTLRRRRRSPRRHARPRSPGYRARRHRHAGRVVRVRQEDDARPRRDGRQHLVQREDEIGPRHPTRTVRPPTTRRVELEDLEAPAAGTSASQIVPVGRGRQQATAMAMMPSSRPLVSSRLSGSTPEMPARRPRPSPRRTADRRRSVRRRASAARPARAASSRRCSRSGGAAARRTFGRPVVVAHRRLCPAARFSRMSIEPRAREPLGTRQRQDGRRQRARVPRESRAARP